MATNQEKRALWESRLREYKASGEKMVDWCVKEGINIEAFRYWTNKENRQATPQEIGRQKQNHGVFILAEPDNDRACNNEDKASPIVVTIGRAAIEIKSGCDAAMLADVLRAVAATC